MAQASDDAFRYCVGPGPSWYLTISVSRRNGFQWNVDWVVRPLDEGRMRAALSGDTESLRLVFGEQTARGWVEIEHGAYADYCRDGILSRVGLKSAGISGHVRYWPIAGTWQGGE